MDCNVSQVSAKRIEAPSGVDTQGVSMLARGPGPPKGGIRPTLCALTQGAERGDCAGGERERGATEGTKNDRRNTAEANQEADRSG